MVKLADGTKLYETKEPGTYSVFRDEARLWSNRPVPCPYETVVRVSK